MMLKSITIIVLLQIYVLRGTSATTLAPRNANTMTSLPANYQQYLPAQPINVRSVCRWLPRFAISTTNGNITITCLTNLTVIGQEIQNHFRKNGRSLSEDVYNSLQVKSNAYLTRDSYVSLCMLSCSEGQAYPRHKTMPPAGALEPNDVNIGCDDRTNMKCRGSCSTSHLNVQNGFVRCTNEGFGNSRCIVQCHPNYIRTGPKEIICNPSNLTWEPATSFSCQAFCPAVLIATNGIVSCTNHGYVGSICTLTCHSGYRVRGSNRKLCVYQTWLPASPFLCERDLSCDVLPEVANGRLNCTNSNDLWSRCSLGCDDGYSPVGTVEQRCIRGPNLTSSWLVTRRKIDPRFTQSASDMSCVGQSNVTLSVRKAGLAELLRLRRVHACSIPIPPSRREICSAANRQQCESRNCCWDSSRISPMPCYRPARRPIIRIPSNPSPTLIPSRPGPDSKSVPFNPKIVGRFANRGDSGPVSSAPRSNSPMCGCTLSNPLLETCSSSASTPHPPSPPTLPSGNEIVLGAVNRNGVNLKSLRLLKQRVYLGYDASPADWPWHAVVLFNPNLCGGTLITPSYVITAAHCVGHYNESSQPTGMIAFGVRNISTSRGNTQIRKSVAVIRHENFTHTPDGYSRNDVAIIKLNSPVNVKGRFPRPLCLPENRIPEVTDECYVTGFGETSESGNRSELLQQACVPLVSMTQCQRYYNNHVIPGQHLCAGKERSNTADTCRGDSGGPLVCRKPGSGRCGWYLAGITSFGRSPCGSGTPSVYMNVFQYQSWIYETIQRLNRMES